MTAWAKVCIVGGGSKIQAYGAQHEGEYHDASFVRVSFSFSSEINHGTHQPVQYKVLEDRNARHVHRPEELICTINYGRLEVILECVVQPSIMLCLKSAHQYLLATVTHCKTKGDNATINPVLYSELEGTFHFVDLMAVVAVVGHVKVGTRMPKFGIIDQSEDLAQALFHDSEGGKDD